MITVVLDQTGDNCDAPDPESAVRAALELMDDLRRASLRQGLTKSLTASFYVEGAFVRQANYQTLYAT